MTMRLLPLFCAALLLPTTVTARPPSIVIIMADDLGWADVGCYGAALQHTPAIDKLASEGVRFTHATGSQTVGAASVAGLLTGVTPARLQLTDGVPGRPSMPSQRQLGAPSRPDLPAERDTVAELFGKAGYTTGYFGSWRFADAGASTHGFAHTVSGTSSSPDGSKGERALTAQATAWMTAHKDEPFLCFMSPYSPVLPLSAPPDLVARYKAKGAPNPTYAAMVEILDDCVRSTVETIDQLGLKENTIVIFLSDNGGASTIEGVNTPATSNAPLRGGKGTLYEGGLRVPCIMRWPDKLPAAKVENYPTYNCDLLPTLLSAAGLKPGAQPVDGIDLWPYLTGGPKPVRTTLCWHYPHYNGQRGFPAGAVRFVDWKLIEHFDDGHTELFNLALDPSESQNLALSMPGRVALLRKRLHDWRLQTGATMMPGPNPAYDPTAAWHLILPGKDGTLFLDGPLAEIHGHPLLYETPPHKNTIGYWTKIEDYPSWDIQLAQPGAYKVLVRYGCGKDSGGSAIDFSAGGVTIPWTVEETGGFQTWRDLELGTMSLPAGRHSFTVKVKSKPGVAVMDIPWIKLIPTEPPPPQK